MRNAVEKGPDVKIQDPLLLPGALAGDGQRVMGGPPRMVTVAIGMEDRLKLFLQQPGGCGLGYPVGRAGDGDFILPLLQARVGLDPVSWDWRWPRAWRLCCHDGGGH